MRQKRQAIVSGSLAVVAILSGTILASANIYADDSVVDEVDIAVPVSCSLEGTGMTSHNANMVNGTVNSAIGETTMKAFCNDNEGFAIYAIGYTDNTDGKNVLTSSALGSTHDIATGTATSGANSNWAMKLSTVSSPTPTYPITIQNSFGSFHAVPDDYALVAKRTSATDIGQNAEGSTLKSTYQTFISQTQPAGTYTGQVKYVLVHPNDTDRPVRSDQIAVVYDGNGLSFSGDRTTNQVVYGTTPMYQSTTATISKSSNSDNNGNFNSIGETYDLTPVTISGADALKVVLKYNVGDDLGCMGVTANYVDDFDYAVCEQGDYKDYYDWNLATWSGSDTVTYYIYGDTVTFNFFIWDGGSDVGYFAQIYPVYTTSQSGTEEVSDFLAAQTGAYTQTTTWNGKWYTTVNGDVKWFKNENEVLNYLEDNKTTLLGTTIHVYSYFPYKILYNGNNATAGTMNSFYTSLDITNDTINILAPNFYKTGYGFAGWSENPSASVNSSETIYGPSEYITGTDLSFNSSTHETTLYAVWVPTAGTMQGWSGCSSLGSGEVTALTDNRDNNVYTVGKMQDGNCWMMENMRLSNTAATLSSSNTNNPAFSSLAATSDSWCTQTTQSSCVNQSKLNTNNTNIGGNNASGTTLIVAPGGNSGSIGYSGNNYQWYSYGNKYNWYSATAGHGMYSTNAAASGDICPNGWHLPYGGNVNSNGGFVYLDTMMGGSGSEQFGIEHINRWLSYPNNMVIGAGSWRDNADSSRGERAEYWSRSPYGVNAYAYALKLDNDKWEFASGPKFYRAKVNGLSVRCIKQP